MDVDEFNQFAAAEPGEVDAAKTSSLEDYLTSWGLGMYIDKFKEHSVDLDTLQILSPEDLKELVPVIGHRAKLTSQIIMLKGIVTDAFCEKNTAEALLANKDQKIYLLNDSETLLVLDDEQVADQQTPKLNDLASDTNKDCELYKLLSSCNEGKGLLLQFQESGLLDNAARRRLCNIIINNELKDYPEKCITTSRLYQLAYTITQVFKKESASVYFIPFSSFSPQQKISAKGKLLDCYRQKRRVFLKSGVIKGKEKNANSSPAGTRSNLEVQGPSTSVQDLTLKLPESADDLHDKILWLKNCTDPWETVEQYWSFTTKERLTLLQSNNLTIQQYYDEFKALNQPGGIFLVNTPVSLPVGSWALRVVTRQKSSTAREIYDFDQDLYILFNPWNPDDPTYMEDCTLLQEYVLNDMGKVWVGPIKTTRGKAWSYGQFDAVVLPACMFMLDRAGIPFHQRGDPVKMTRCISRIVNSNDDAGVLIGRWDGEYGDGTAPSEWTGSVEILAQYLETQQEVPYGQCWVFAGVVTTVCRALGIPSRVVSNLVSAHDANNSLTVDKYYTENMEELDFDPNNPQGADSIWNYHVWNDVWMARPDLPPGYGGWQAIDATPQETSAGMYQCGPASLEAIKQGVIGVGYDVEFMLASVNADLMRWRKDPDAETGYSMVDTNNFHIGRMVLTKKPYVFDPLGDEDREDITAQYKHREGTASERLALMNGVRFSERAKRYYSVANTLKNDVKFSLRDIDNVLIGKEFRIVVDIENVSEEPRNIKASLSATSVFYNGVKADVVKKVEGKIFVGPNKKEQISILIRSEDYLPKLVEYCNMKISAMAIVEENKQSWADDDDFQILKPNITIKFNEDLIIGQPTTAVLSFPNPLERALSGCEFRLTSSGIAGRTLRFQAADVASKGLVTAELPVQPNKIGKINFVATFKSDELKDINGAASVEVFEG